MSKIRANGLAAEALSTEVEDALFEADDAAILAAPGMRTLASDARAIVQQAARAFRRPVTTMAAEPRRRSRRLPGRAAPRRVLMRELLVASPRARDVVGKASADAMSDMEIEAALERLAALGMVPDPKA